MISILIVSQNLELQRKACQDKLRAVSLTAVDPAVLWIEQEPDQNLSIKEVKQIKDHFYLKPADDKPQVVIVLNAEKLSHDAQNALLKILEEPPQTAQLILAASSLNTLLPTIISRCQVETVQGTSDNGQWTINPVITKLLTSNLEDRFKIIEQTEDKSALLLALESYFAEKLKTDPESLATIKLILEAKEWAAANGNLRGILEYLMIHIS